MYKEMVDAGLCLFEYRLLSKVQEWAIIQDI